MISAIVLAGEPSVERHEAVHVGRTLAWLVSATVAGLVRDVVLAAPPESAEFAFVAEQTGCELVVGSSERERLDSAGRAVKCERVVVLRAGVAGTPDLIDELLLLEGAQASNRTAIILRADDKRWFPPLRRRVLGLVVSRSECREASSFDLLARRARSRSTRLRSRLRLLD